MKVAILPQAKRDLVDGFWFYEEQQPGLGSRFHDDLSIAVSSLSQTAGAHRKFGRYHRLLIRSFPYAVYYPVSGGTCYVDAVVDCRRDPQWIRGHLGSD